MSSKLIILLFCFVLSISISKGQLFGVSTTKFEKCSSISTIDIDEIFRTNDLIIPIRIVIFRAESDTYHDEVITPLGKHISQFDTNKIHIYSYELTKRLGSSSCFFPYLLNKSFKRTKGNPEFLCLMVNDSAIREIVLKNLDVLPSDENPNYLFLKGTYRNSQEFYEKFNALLKKLDELEFLKPVAFLANKTSDPIRNDIVKNDKYFTANFIYGISNNVSKVGSNNLDLSLNVLQSFGFEFSIQNYFNDYFGLNVGVGINSMRLETSPNQKTIVEIVNDRDIDADGQEYKRVAYGTNLKENLEIDYFTFVLSPLIRFKFRNNKNSQLVISPSIKLGSAISSKTNVTSGKLTYGGIYDFNPNDTSYFNLYDFNTRSISTSKNNLSILSNYLIKNLTVTYNYSNDGPLKFNCGFSYDFAKVTILGDFQDKKLPTQPQYYSSLFYRFGAFEYKTLFAFVGITYSLNE